MTMTIHCHLFFLFLHNKKGLLLYAIFCSLKRDWSIVWILWISFPACPLFGRYYTTKQTRWIAENLALYAAFLVVKVICIDHRGWSTSQKYARNPLVSSRTFLAASRPFFVRSIVCFWWAIRIWVFFPFKHPIWGGQQQKCRTKCSSL